MRALLPWVGAFLVAALAAGGAVVALNATVFGPGDFVRVYLDALARGDADSALALPGVVVPSIDGVDADGRLLVDGVLSGVGDIHQLSDQAIGGGHDRHRITVSWTTPGGDGTTAFEVERVGTRFGLFPEWGFAASPVAVLALDVQHDPRFTANGFDASTGRDRTGSAALAVLVPGTYVLSHDTEFLRAAPFTVVAAEAGAIIDATLDVEPRPELSAAVAGAVTEQLAACAEQRVLFPTGCPFGHPILNRVVSAPSWTIVTAPNLELTPGRFGTWVAGPAPGTAHLVVKVKSLFDGSVSTFDEDVPFSVRYAVVITGESVQVTHTDVVPGSD
ncbi:hypothetical protein BH09ACT4_BH09ACT4_04550 [soil metagenome]